METLIFVVSVFIYICVESKKTATREYKQWMEDHKEDRHHYTDYGHHRSIKDEHIK